MKKSPGSGITRTLLLCGIAVSACDTPEPAAAPFAPQLEVSATPSLIACPSSEPRQARGYVPFDGGQVTLEGSSVVVPVGALDGGAQIAIDEPASPHMRVDLSVNGHEHWQFLQPLRVTIDYSRCPAEALGNAAISVWYLDPETGEPIQNMGGTDNRRLRQITFYTDHFSGYAIAN